MAKYDQIQNGMTYDQVVGIVGGPGESISESEVGGYKTAMYKWDGKSLGANANVTFQNDAVLAKAQFGLE